MIHEQRTSQRSNKTYQLAEKSTITGTSDLTTVLSNSPGDNSLEQHVSKHGEILIEWSLHHCTKFGHSRPC